VNDVTTLLDCPACQAAGGLVPQREGARDYLACPLCRFWYPIRDEVPVLLPPARNPEGLTRPLGPAAPWPVPHRQGAFVDRKLLAYSYAVRLDEFGAAFAVHDERLVVDVGCSTGSLAAWLRPQQAYLGIDLSWESLRFARRGSGRLYVQADAARLPLRTGAVPFFAARDLLEHLDDAAAGVRELHRIGGRGVVVVPTLGFPFLYDPLNWLLVRWGRRAPFGVYGYGHRRVHDPAGWRALLQEAALEIQREEPIGTGVALNASDLVWHAAYSWREFDRLPRRGLPWGLAPGLFRLGRALHRLQRPFSRAASSRAFQVSRS
jgi:SAM-dependent methyltransferase